MSNPSEYNGWSNYETWNYKMWMDNDGSDYWIEQAGNLLNQEDPDDALDKIEATSMLAGQLKDECDEQLEQWMPDQAGPFADMINGSVCSINWHEIAAALIEDAS